MMLKSHSKKPEKENELIYPKNKNLHIEFISVHKSKGLEEDNVILINPRK